jgi:hypothetical protein
MDYLITFLTITTVRIDISKRPRKPSIPAKSAILSFIGAMSPYPIVKNVIVLKYNPLKTERNI